jgi:hypothetical protein
MLSNYMTGKNIPEMRLVEKCIKRFKLEREEVREIFLKTFSSATRTNHKIILDMRYFKKERLDLLVQAITILLLSHPTLSLPYDLTVVNLEDTIKKFIPRWIFRTLNSSLSREGLR